MGRGRSCFGRCEVTNDNYANAELGHYISNVIWLASFSMTSASPRTMNCTKGKNTEA